MLNIGLINDYPFSVAFGGKEIQLLTYESMLSKHHDKDIAFKKLDIWDKNNLDGIDILHFFGHSNWYYDIINSLNVNYPNLKTVVSPTIYFQNFKVVRSASLLSKICPLPNTFFYKKTFFRKCDKIIVNSHSEKDQLISIFGKNLKNKIAVLYNGIENDFCNFDDDTNKSLFLEKFNLTEGYLLSVGFIDARKNRLNLIKAFLNIHKIINKKLVIIGDFRFHKEKDVRTTRKLISDHPDKILHIPYIDRQSDLLKSAYCNCSSHLLPSHLETPGLSNLEALYFNKCIVVGDCKPVREYFKDYAIYCNSESIKSIESAIIKSLHVETKYNYKQYIENNYTLNVISELLFKYYSAMSEYATS